MNVYFLAAGALMILLSIGHAFWGERKIFHALPLEGETLVSLYVPWHQITFVLLASGVGLILAAFAPEAAYLPVLIIAIVIGNFAIFILIAIVRQQTALFRKTVPQSILFLVLIALILVGIAR